MEGFPLQYLLQFIDFDTSLCCRSVFHGLGIYCKKWDELGTLLQRNDIHEIFEFAYQNGSVKLAEYCLLRGGIDQSEVNCGLRSACEVCEGEALAELMISYGADDWNGGLFNACVRGCKEMIELMLSKGAIDWDNGLQCACMGGHKVLAELMISKGATDLDNGLCGACMGGHKELAELMISKGATDWNLGLQGACEGGRKELAELMISKGANHWNSGLYSACGMGHKELAKLMVSHGANNCDNCHKSMWSHSN
jgi:hypothetical protein